MAKKFFKDFNQNRTPFFRSGLFTLIESIIPGVVIWILIGFDLSISMNNQLPSPKGLYIFLICLGYFFYTLLVTYFFYKIKFHKSDNFTFSLTLTSIFILLIVLGSFLQNISWMIFLKFLIILLAIICLVPLFVFISLFLKNQELKMQEDLDKMYQAYKDQTTIPTKHLLKVQRYEKYLLKKNKEKEELEIFKSELNKKIQEELLDKEQKEKIKFEKINTKLDKKESKMRSKKRK